MRHRLLPTSPASCRLAEIDVKRRMNSVNAWAFGREVLPARSPRRRGAYGMGLIEGLIVEMVLSRGLGDKNGDWAG